MAARPPIINLMVAFNRLRSVVKIRSGKVRIDTPVFRLHYRATFLFLMGASILVTILQTNKEHIQCIQDGVIVPAIRTDVVNNYCFISTTYTVPKYHNRSYVDDGFMGKGLGPHDDDDELKYHAYYQWVPFVLFGQALMFYAPYAIWKVLDNNKIKFVIQGLNVWTLREDTKSPKSVREQLLAEYLFRHINDHTCWALQFFLCELLNVVNVCGQIFLIDSFLGGEFITYGLDVVRFLEMDPKDRIDPMERVFPKVTKCTFHKFGPSGTVNRHDILCVLKLNIINEKIYTFLWFWLVALGLLTVMDFLVRILIVFVSPLRTLVIRSRLPGAAGKERAEKLMRRCQLGDFLLLDMISKNMDPIHFGNAVDHLIRKFSDVSFIIN